MEFTDTPATRMTERIMREIKKLTVASDPTRLDADRYNRIYEAVFELSTTELAACERLRNERNELCRMITEYLPVCFGDCACEGANLGCEILDESDIETVQQISLAMGDRR